jgi:hypothetical protein
VFSFAAAACTPLRMTAPETGGGGTGGAGAGTGGSEAGAGGDTGGTGGSAAGTAGNAGNTGATGGSVLGGAGGSGGRGGGGAGGTGGAVAGTAGMGGRGGRGGGGGRGGSGGAGNNGGRGGAGGTGGAEPAGLIAFWRFDEGTGMTIADSSGNGQTLTMSDTGANFVTGHDGSGMSFDGTTAYAYVVPVGSQPLLSYPASALTMSAWAKPDDTTNRQPFATIVARAHEDYLFEDFWLGFVSGKPACTIHNPDWQGAVASTEAPAGVWTHIACTYDPSGMITLYVNGVDVASFTSNETLGPIPTRILVGAAETDALQAFLPGFVDDIRIYKDALTSAEVASIAR